jgi:hypothetical protein
MLVYYTDGKSYSPFVKYRCKTAFQLSAYVAKDEYRTHPILKLEKNAENLFLRTAVLLNYTAVILKG